MLAGFFGDSGSRSSIEKQTSGSWQSSDETFPAWRRSSSSKALRSSVGDNALPKLGISKNLKRNLRASSRFPTRRSSLENRSLRASARFSWTFRRSVDSVGQSSDDSRPKWKGSFESSLSDPSTDGCAEKTSSRGSTSFSGSTSRSSE